MAAPAPTANASSSSATGRSGLSRLSLWRTWYPAIAPASAPSPPRTAPLAGAPFAAVCMTAPQIAPDAIRQAIDAASKRLGVKGNLSATSSLTTNSAIVFDALAETILEYGEPPERIHPR